MFQEELVHVSQAFIFLPFICFQTYFYEIGLLVPALASPHRYRLALQLYSHCIWIKNLALKDNLMNAMIYCLFNITMGLFLADLISLKLKHINSGTKHSKCKQPMLFILWRWYIPCGSLFQNATFTMLVWITIVKYYFFCCVITIFLRIKEVV